MRITTTTCIALVVFLTTLSFTCSSNDSLLTLLSTAKDSDRVERLNELFLTYEYLHQDSAELFLKESLELAEELNYYAGYADANLYMGYLYDDKGDYEKALQYVNTYLSLAKEKNDDIRISKAHNNLGIIFFDLGDYEKSLKHYLEALSLQKNKIQDTTRIHVLSSNIGNVYLALEKYDEAIPYLEACRKYFKEAGYAWNLAQVLSNLSVAYDYFNRLDEAEEILNESLVIRKSINDYYGLTSTYGNIGNILYRKGDYKACLENHLKAQEVIEQYISDPYTIANNLKNIALSNYYLNNYEEALADINKALSIADSINGKKLLKDIYSSISQIYEAKGDYQKSLENYKLFTTYKDSIFNESKSKEMGKLEAKYEMERKLEEEQRMREAELRNLAAQKTRRDNLQYSGIFVVVLILFAAVFMSGKFSISERVAEGLIFFTFLLFFEFMLVLLDPTIEEWSSGQPAYKLIFNAVLAGLIFPLHSFFEAKLKTKLLRKNVLSDDKVNSES